MQGFFFSLTVGYYCAMETALPLGKKLRILFWAMFAAPVWLFLFVQFSNSEPVTWIDDLEYKQYIEYIFPALMLMAIAISWLIRKNRISRLYETFDTVSVHQLITSTMLISCSIIELTVLLTILAYFFLQMENLIFYAMIGLAGMLIHYPSDSKIRGYLNHTNEL